jgi:PhnB protein
MSPKPIPDDYPRLSPYLCVDDAAAAVEFYSNVFGFEERLRIPAPGGKVGHSELQLGSAVVMVSDEYPEMGVLGPKAIGGTAVTISLYVEDVDATFAAAVAAGAEVVEGVEDRFYGDRSGQISDPWGHRWSLATHLEDLTTDELLSRAEAMFG